MASQEGSEGSQPVIQLQEQADQCCGVSVAILSMQWHDMFLLQSVAPCCCCCWLLQATYEGIPLVTSQGLVTLPAEIPDGAGIH
jgi:hypothetical protein